MPVEKFRSIEEMNSAPLRATAEDAFDRFLRHWTRYLVVRTRTYPAGIFRFRTLEEAQEARKQA